MKRRGVTLVETVIAMFLITVLTAGAFTLCSTAVVRVDRVEKQFRAQSACKDVIECYKVTESVSTELENKLKIVNSNAKLAESGYVLTYADFNVVASLSEDKHTLTVVATDFSGDELCKTSYFKGGAA